jgi:hypothetical protein
MVLAFKAIAMIGERPLGGKSPQGGRFAPFIATADTRGAPRAYSSRRRVRQDRRMLHLQIAALHLGVCAAEASRLQWMEKSPTLPPFFRL